MTKRAVDELGKAYTYIISKKDGFLKDLLSEVDKWELSKRDLIKEWKLNSISPNILGMIQLWIS